MEIIGQGGGPHGGADAFTNILLPPYFRKNHRRLRPPWRYDLDPDVDPDLALDLQWASIVSSARIHRDTSQSSASPRTSMQIDGTQ